MSHQADLVARFWKTLKADRTVMLGLSEVEGGHAQPMTALFEGDHSGPLWIFTSSETSLVSALGSETRDGILNFVSKGHELFATVQGRLCLDTDRATVDRLWNPVIAAWYAGREDPKLRLLRFEPGAAQIWLNEHSLMAGVKMLLGADPKADYKDKVAEVRL